MTKHQFYNMVCTVYSITLPKVYRHPNFSLFGRGLQLQKKNKNPNATVQSDIYTTVCFQLCGSGLMSIIQQSHGRVFGRPHTFGQAVKVRQPPRSLREHSVFFSDLYKMIISDQI